MEGYVCFLFTVLLIASTNAKCNSYEDQKYECKNGYLLDLSTIPDSATHITVMDTRGCYFNKFILSPFARNLRSIHISNCSHIAIPDNVLSALSQLESFTITRTYLPRVEASWFKDIVSLKSLVLNDNKIGTIDEGAFGTLSNLRELNLNGNKLTELNTEWFGNTTMAIWYFTVENNTISKIGDNFFSKLPKLDGLILASNKPSENKIHWLNYFHPQLEDLAVLKMLDITNNDLSCEDIQEIMFGLKKLETFHIKGNSNCSTSLQALALQQHIELIM